MMSQRPPGRRWGSCRTARGGTTVTASCGCVVTSTSWRPRSTRDWKRCTRQACSRGSWRAPASSQLGKTCGSTCGTSWLGSESAAPRCGGRPPPHSVVLGECNHEKCVRVVASDVGSLSPCPDPSLSPCPNPRRPRSRDAGAAQAHQELEQCLGGQGVCGARVKRGERQRISS
jgi:hypothetical protein